MAVAADAVLVVLLQFDQLEKNVRDAPISFLPGIDESVFHVDRRHRFPANP